MPFFLVSLITFQAGKIIKTPDCGHPGADWPEGQARIFNAQHVTLVSVTGMGPVQLLMGRCIKTGYQLFPVRF